MDRGFETPDDFSWNEPVTANVCAAEAFYSAVRRWTLKKENSASGPHTTIEAGGEPIGGIMRLPETIPAAAPPRWTPHVTVKDVDAAGRRTQEDGGTVLVPPTDIPSIGRFCSLPDPQGAVLNAIPYARPSS